MCVMYTWQFGELIRSKSSVLQHSHEVWELLQLLLLQLVDQVCPCKVCHATPFLLFLPLPQSFTRQTNHQSIFSGEPGPYRMVNSSSGPLGIAIHNTALFRCTPTSIQAVSVDNGSVLSTQEVPRAYGSPIALTVSGSTVVAVTSTLAVCAYTVSRRGVQLKETSCGRLAPDNNGAHFQPPVLHVKSHPCSLNLIWKLPALCYEAENCCF